jgi:uncharacterized protein YndB with AHSA1/START domain
MADLIEINAAIQIAKPVDEVYEAIVDPAQMCNYFISKGTVRMTEGAEVTWKFPEFDFEVPVKVIKAERGEKITFLWGEEGKEDTVDITLQNVAEKATVVRVKESGRKNDEAGLDWLKGNTEGWANFLACMKAWLEYGINLRKGAFEFRRGEM